MNEIRSIDSLIRTHAHASVELLNHFGNVPANPFPKESESHKAWAAEFYQYSLARGIDALAEAA